MKYLSRIVNVIYIFESSYLPWILIMIYILKIINFKYDIYTLFNITFSCRKCLSFLIKFTLLLIIQNTHVILFIIIYFTFNKNQVYNLSV